ncbi:hypothetical protein GUJ93_ZPchr0010g9518 [Zizania palustris]|uniref:Phosphofructokinase domain-containing protein n=1 Tax=Zizania palustris TaxID=103762 RepID=A0A8J5W8Z9_ZIZPA|nr:hypothetical protein GUJ93_ZPchr0010g9518 [Zizania palustris]
MAARGARGGRRRPQSGGARAAHGGPSRGAATANRGTAARPAVGGPSRGAAVATTARRRSPAHGSPARRAGARRRSSPRRPEALLAAAAARGLPLLARSESESDCDSDSDSESESDSDSHSDCDSDSHSDSDSDCDSDSESDSDSDSELSPPFLSNAASLGLGRGTHFRRARPRQQVYFQPDEVSAGIVTCGGLCPGLNTVVRELVCGLHHMYGVTNVVGIEGGYKGFYASNTVELTPRSVNDIHKRGGTVLGTSRGGHDTTKIVDSIQDRGINQVYIIGGDGTQKGAATIHEEVQRRGLKCAVVGIPKTIDNDIVVIDKSFGFDTAVEEARRAINVAHVEAESTENGVGVVKLMSRNSGFIAMYATLASRDVDCCLIPESPFYLDGKRGLLEFAEQRLRENGHMVIVVAEGAGQDLIAKSMNLADAHDASGNKLLLDVGLWLCHKIKEHFKKKASFPSPSSTSTRPK